MAHTIRLIPMHCSFEIAAAQAFRNASRQAKASLLEPIMKLTITTPDEYVGDVTSDLNKSRGHIEDVAAMLGFQIVYAKAPLSEMFGYVTALQDHYLRKSIRKYGIFSLPGSSKGTGR